MADVAAGAGIQQRSREIRARRDARPHRAALSRLHVGGRALYRRAQRLWPFRHRRLYADAAQRRADRRAACFHRFGRNPAKHGGDRACLGHYRFGGAAGAGRGRRRRQAWHGRALAAAAPHPRDAPSGGACHAWRDRRRHRADHRRDLDHHRHAPGSRRVLALLRRPAVPAAVRRDRRRYRRGAAARAQPQAQVRRSRGRAGERESRVRIRSAVDHARRHRALSRGGADRARAVPARRFHRHRHQRHRLDARRPRARASRLCADQGAATELLRPRGYQDADDLRRHRHGRQCGVEHHAVHDHRRHRHRHRHRALRLDQRRPAVQPRTGSARASPSIRSFAAASWASSPRAP